MKRIVIVLLSCAAPVGAWAQAPAHDDAPRPTVAALIDAGRYDDAEAEARLAAEATTAGPEDQRLASREFLVEALLHNGRGGDPATLALARTLVEPGGRGAADGRRQRLVGAVFLDAGRYREAAARFGLALAADERARGRLHLDVAEDLDSLARAWSWLERYDDALAASQRALRIREAIAEPRRAAVFRTLAIRGLIWQRKAVHARAAADMTRAIALAEAAGASAPEMAWLLALYGDELAVENETASASAVLGRARGLADASLRRGHPDLAAVLRPQAIVLHRQGQTDQARALRERAVALTEQAYGGSHPLVALQLNDLVESLANAGDYVAARRTLARALAIYERRLGPAHSYVATALYNLGVINSSLGDFAEAARLHGRAITLWERVAGPTHPFLAWALAGRAEAKARQGRDREAVRDYERALAIRERRLGPTHGLVARTLAALAGCLVRLGAVARAEALAARALAIRQAEDSPAGLAEALLVRGQVQAAKGDHAAALMSFDRALAVSQPLFGAAHPVIAEVEAGRAPALAASGRPADALAAALRAEAVGRVHLRLTVSGLSERQALAYASTRPRGLAQALSLLPAGDPARDVFDAVIRGRALVLDEMASRQRLRADAAGSDLAPLWAALAVARQKLAGLAVRGPADDDAARYAVELDRARRDKEQQEGVLAERSAGLRRELARAEVGVEQVLAALPEGSALVSFARYDRLPGGVPSYMAFVIRTGQPEPVAIPLGPARAVDAAIARWRRQVLAGLTPAGAMAPGAERALRPLGEAVRRQVWDPVAARLGDADRVFIVPDAAINLVPFAALPVARDAFLIDAPITIHYLSAERDLAGTVDPVPRPGAGLLAIGGPAYDEPTRAVASRAAATFSTRGASAAACATLQSIAFDGLPASRREAEEVAALWRRLGGAAPDAAGAARVLTGRAASEAAFRRAGVGQRILHLATHGFFVQERCEAPAANLAGTRSVGGLTGAPTSPSRMPAIGNPLVLSGLALAGANQRRSAGVGDDDGILTAEEVAAMDLTGTEWAVLSACDTGLGEIRSGEGVFGLRRAFQMAGARTVIMSLWAVDDRASREWMRALYEGRLASGLGTADAVREASRAVLRDRRASHRSVHPFYWAGFVAAGDWR